MINNMDKLLKILEKWNIEFNGNFKRMEIDGNRDWYFRYIWFARNFESENELTCGWNGFSNQDECINDLIDTISKVQS